MNKNSKGLRVLVAAGIGIAGLWVPLAGAQQAEPLLHEQLIDGVRGLFGRFFRADDKAASEAPSTAPAAPSAPPPAGPVQTRAADSPAIVAAPAALTVGRSLHEAVVRGDYEATLKLLEGGTDIESRDPGSGASPLHYAVMKGRMQIVDLLLIRGADVNSRTRNGTTPLHTAALYARKEVAERLIEQKADINAVSGSGATPLALANAAKNRPMADMLRARGAN